MIPLHVDVGTVGDMPLGLFHHMEALPLQPWGRVAVMRPTARRERSPEGQLAMTVKGHHVEPVVKPRVHADYMRVCMRICMREYVFMHTQAADYQFFTCNRALDLRLVASVSVFLHSVEWALTGLTPSGFTPSMSLAGWCWGLCWA